MFIQEFHKYHSLFFLTPALFRENSGVGLRLVVMADGLVVVVVVLQAALCLYSRAGQRSQFQGPLGLPTAAGLALQLADALELELDRPEAARAHYTRAAELLRSSPLAYLHCLGAIASCRINEGEH